MLTFTLRNQLCYKSPPPLFPSLLTHALSVKRAAENALNQPITRAGELEGTDIETYFKVMGGQLKA